MRTRSNSTPMRIVLAAAAMSLGSASLAAAAPVPASVTLSGEGGGGTAAGSLVSLALDVAASDGLAETPAPAAPAGLEARVYSRTAGEIFWARPTTFGLVYEVTRDGTSSVTTEGTSHFDDTLSEGRTYTYAVVAIDREGRRSAASHVALTTRGDGPVAGPAAPTGLEARVYSRTAGEIFWARPTTFGLVYEVTRDGTSSVTTEGTSHFDDTLSEGRTYTYAVVAIDREGRRSAAASIALATRGDAAPRSMVSRVSYETLIAHAFELYDGGRYNAPLVPFIDGFADVLTVEPSYGPTYEDDGVVRVRYDCESGRAAVALTPTGSIAGEFYEFRFEDCLDGGLTRDGVVDANQGSTAPWVSSEGLVTSAGPGERLVFSGYARRGYSEGRSFLHPTWETVDLNLVGQDAEGAFALERASTRFAFAFIPFVDAASLSGGFTIRSEATGGRALHARIPLEFAYEWDYREPPGSSAGQVPRTDPSAPWSAADPSVANRRLDWYFASGQLELVGEDGSRVLLDADTGDATTVRITIDDDTGTDTFETLWTPWRPLLRLGRGADDGAG